MIEKKSFMMALKRAFQTGTFNYVGQQAKQFPKQLCHIQDLQIDDQNWWDCNPITKLDLSNNQIQQIPRDLIVLADLQVIRMKNNRVKQLPISLVSLQNLKSLDLSHNKLIYLAKQFQSLPAIVQINFSQNQLEYLPNLKNLKTLQFIFIDRNKIKQLPEFGKGIKKIQGFSNQIKQLKKRQFQLCNNLQHLNVSKNLIQFIEPNTFNNAKNLISLQLKQNRLLQFKQVPNSQKLDTISLSFNKLTQYNQFQKSPNLTVLILSDNKIKILSKNIIQLTKLKTLDISNNDLSDLPCQIGFINSLVRIQVQGNPLKSIRQNIRVGGTNIIKKYLQEKMDPKQKSKIQSIISTSFQKVSPDQYWNKLIQQFNQNGQLILRKLSLTQISPIVYQKIFKGINLSQNKINKLSQNIINLQSLKYLIVNNNQLQQLPTNLAYLQNLQQIQAKNNYLQHFCRNINKKNPFKNLHYLDLSANRIKIFPKQILLINKLRTLHLSYNNLIQIDDIWNPNYLPKLQIIDFSNNQINQISQNIYKKLSLNYVNFQNNNITKIPTIIGFMRLSGCKIDGNPIKLIKRAVIQKGTVAILQYLRTKHVGPIPDMPVKMDIQEPIKEEIVQQKEIPIKIQQFKSQKIENNQKNQMEEYQKKQRIQQIQQTLKSLQRQLQSNMSMNNIQKNQRKKKMQALMIQRNKLMK